MTEHTPLPADLAAAHAMILAERAARLAAEALMAGARLEIERLKLLLAKARREQYGQSSERGAKIIAQLELQLAELEETAAQEETAAAITAPASMRGERAPGARKPARRPLPEHLPRERIVYPAPCACPNCGGALRKLGEDVTETLECVPRHLEGGRARPREVQLPRLRGDHAAAGAVPPDRPRPRRPQPAGPGAGREVRASPPAPPAERDLRPGRRRDRRLDLGRLGRRRQRDCDAAGPGDPDAMSSPPSVSTPTTRPCRCWPRRRRKIGRLWVHVRDDRPFGGSDPPAAAFFYSPDRGGEHPERQLAGFPGSCRPTPTPGSIASTRRTASPARSSRQLAGRMPGGNSSSSPRWPRRRSRPRRYGASTSCSRSSATSTAAARTSAGVPARRSRRRSLPSSSPGCAPSRTGSRASPRPARRSPTPSSAGRHSPGSSTTAASA